MITFGLLSFDISEKEKMMESLVVMNNKQPSIHRMA